VDLLQEPDVVLKRAGEIQQEAALRHNHLSNQHLEGIEQKAAHRPHQQQPKQANSNNDDGSVHASFVEQLHQLVYRSWITFYRTPMLIPSKLLQVFALGCLIGLTFYHLGR
jgi:hypothetical protein